MLRDGLYSAGIPDETRGSPSHYFARCWDGLLLRRNLQCYTDSSVRTTPADAGKGFYSVGSCNGIKETPLALLRSRLERACTPPDSAMKRKQFRSHYSATCRDGLLLRRNLRSHVGNSARITPPYAGTSVPPPNSAMECCYLALLRRMPGHKNRQRPTRAGVTQREVYGGRCGRRAWHIRAPHQTRSAFARPEAKTGQPGEARNWCR